MTRSRVPLIAILILGVSVAVAAQMQFSGVVPADVLIVERAHVTQAAPDTVVARLMSFDRDRDGRLVRDELPERMHDVISRVDTSGEGAIDSAEVLAFAATPRPQQGLRELPISTYGFGGSLQQDTLLHIEGAIDDLRLAAGVRDDAMAIARQFQAGAAPRAKQALFTALSELLPPERFDAFKREFEGTVVTVPAFQSGGTMFFGANSQDLALHKLTSTTVMLNRGRATNRVDTEGLDPETQQRVARAVQEFSATPRGELTDYDRRELIAQLAHLLDDQQRDDLRAALERRPLVKQGRAVEFAVLAQELQEQLQRQRTRMAEPGVTVFVAPPVVIR